MRLEVELLANAAAAAIREFSGGGARVLAPGQRRIDRSGDIIRHLLPRDGVHHMVPRYIRIVDELPKLPPPRLKNISCGPLSYADNASAQILSSSAVKIWTHQRSPA
jgi:hypothetical protein